MRMKTRKDLRRERRYRRHSCWDHLIAAPLWPLHGVNLGTLLRTCDAAGACLAVPKLSWVPSALEKSYTFKHPSCVHWLRPWPPDDPDLVAVSFLEEQANRDDTQIVGVELADEAVRLADLPAARTRTVMVLGNEQSGIPPEAVDYLDVCVEIPMVGHGTTLNVAVAGSLVLYKLAGLL